MSGGLRFLMACCALTWLSGSGWHTWQIVLAGLAFVALNLSDPEPKQ